MNRFVPERFTLIRTIGENRHSKTVLADDHLLDRENVVVRIIKKDHITRSRNELIERLSWLVGVQHRYFANVLDAGVTKQQHLYYVREYLPPSQLSSVDFVILIKCLVSAVDFLSVHSWVHGAIKLSNVFVNADTLKLTDSVVGQRLGDVGESLHFIAPEILQGSNPSQAGDLYSLGAVLYRVLTGRHLFEDHDQNRLRSKYLAAFPQPLQYLPGISRLISEGILDLLSKDPEKRIMAFERIKGAIDSKTAPADRAPFVGREAILKQAVQTVEKRATTLRILLVEGEPGIGKSRFITEIRLHCILRGLLFIVWRCTDETDELTTIRDGLRKLLRSEIYPFHANVEKFARVLSDYTATSVAHEKTIPLEKLLSELVFLLGLIARHTPLVLAIENVHLAGAGTLLFLHQLSVRASEIPVTLVLTGRQKEVEPKWVKEIKDCLTSDFIRLRLAQLSQTDAEKLVQFIEVDRQRQSTVLQLSAGNPLFIQEYAKHKASFDYVPEQIADAAVSMISGLTPKARQALEVLSIFRKPVPVKILCLLCGGELSDLESQLKAIEALGIVNQNSEGLEIRPPLLRMKLYEFLTKKRRVCLNRGAFLALREAESNLELLADHAFKGEMFVEAADLHRQLAQNAYRSQKYRAAAAHYEHVQQCNVYCGDVFAVSDRVDVARCYEWLGKSQIARRIYQELLSLDSVHNDSELLSLVYVRLAMALDNNTSREKRIHFQELAISCLSRHAASLGRRYAQLSNLLLMSGDLVRAEQAFQQAQQSTVVAQSGDLSVFDTMRGMLLMTAGDFRGALRCFLSCTQPDRGLSTVAINVAYCLEQLGDLKTALTHLSTAEELTIRSGDTARWALSLANRASIKTKLGEVREADRLFFRAHDAIKGLRRSTNVFPTIPFDAALLRMHMGDYRQAGQWLQKANVSNELMPEMDRLSTNIIRCKLLLNIGQLKNASELLRRSAESKLFRIEFFQIERALIEACIPSISAKNRLDSLEQALTLASDLGTLYQQCEVLISLAAIYFELGEQSKTHDCAKKAVQLAHEKTYRILAARALLLYGLASQSPREKQHFLSDALQLASEMGLQELIAEAAYHIGLLNLESGNAVTAREYLIRSTSITARLADEVPISARSKYLSQKWRRDALQALARCNESLPFDTSVLLNSDGDKYFAAAYEFTMAASVANSIDVLLGSINKMLTTAFTRSALITLESAGYSHSVLVRIKSSPELMERIDLIRKHARNRVYFESADGKGKQVSAWIPLRSETMEGGIYLTCRSSESQFNEKEIDLLTMMGAIGSSALKRLETRQAQDEESRELSEFHGIIGASKQIREVFSQIQMAAANTATVLIEGESGTGKELVARAIHTAGPRTKQPFVPVDCGAIPETLVEAELFGSKKGSYTGAVTDRPGLFEAAHRGTIFLDEISNMTPALQAKLLRVIQEREVRRIGETKGRSIDVRLIVASNQPLHTLAEAGHFRKDLLFRLKVLYIKVPPLRTRRDDIPMLAHAFLQRLNASAKTKKHFAGGVVDHLATQEFAGNVRELQNAIERAFFLTKGIMITAVPVEGHSPTDGGSVEEVQSWFKDLSEGRKDFWSAIHRRYKRRDISREKVVALVDFGLRATRGSYTTMASMFHLKRNDYRRFMDFLRRNDCLLDFRPYRKASGGPA